MVRYLAELFSHILYKRLPPFHITHTAGAQYYRVILRRALLKHARGSAALYVGVGLQRDSNHSNYVRDMVRNLHNTVRESTNMTETETLEQVYSVE